METCFTPFNTQFILIWSTSSTSTSRLPKRKMLVYVKFSDVCVNFTTKSFQCPHTVVKGSNRL